MTERVRPGACGECLQRAWLVGSLAGHIETAVSNTPGSRAREVLALPERGAGAGDGALAGGVLHRAGCRAGPAEMLRGGRRLRGLGDLPPRRGVSGVRSATSATRRRCSSAGETPACLAGLPREDTVTIVGSRRPSHYGREIARELGREIAAAGFAVVSGMAMGIDSCAHRGSARRRRPDDRGARHRRGRSVSTTGHAGSMSGSSSAGWWWESSRRGRRRGAGCSRRATGSWPRSAG